MLAENIVYAAWPQFFRVTAFKATEPGGFEDAGTFPLLCPRTDNVEGWGWLKDQLVEHRLLAKNQAEKVTIELWHGRSIGVKDGRGRRFLMLMPA